LNKFVYPVVFLSQIRNMKTFKIEDLTEKQLRVINDALELYTRIGLGQLYIIASPFGIPAQYCWDNNESNEYQTKTKMAEEHLKVAAELLMNCKNGTTHGIHSDKVNELVKIAYDMQQVTRYVLDNSLPANNIVRNNIPRKTSEEELIRVTNSK